MADRYRRVATVSDLPEGEARVFTLDGKESIALCNAGGAIYAVANLCTHDDGPLGEGTLLGKQIECPRHGALFDIETGKALCLPAVKAIPVYEVELRDGEVWVAPKVEASR